MKDDILVQKWAKVTGLVRKVLEEINQELQLPGGEVKETPEGWSIEWGGKPPGYKITVYLGLEDGQHFFSLSPRLEKPRARDSKELRKLVLAEFESCGLA